MWLYWVKIFWIYLPVRYCFRIRLKKSMSNIVHIIPSRIPICEPIPRAKSIRKKITAQNGAPGSSTIACVNTMNASPVPSAACKFSAIRFYAYYIKDIWTLYTEIYMMQALVYVHMITVEYNKYISLCTKILYLTNQ